MAKRKVYKKVMPPVSKTAPAECPTARPPAVVEVAMKEITEPAVYVSRCNNSEYNITNGIILNVHVGPARIAVNGLHIKPASNWATPHIVTGVGGAEIMLTDKQLCQLISEFMRYVVQGTTKHESNCCGYQFIFSKIVDPNLRGG